MTGAARRAHAIPVIVVYNLPGRDACGRFSTAAGPSASGYETWINQVAAAVGPGDDIVVVEPDALPDIIKGCLSPAQSAQRYQLLRYAMKHLGALPRARVYLDAGNPGMFGDPAQLVRPLRQAGLGYGRGPYTGPDAPPWCNPPGRALGPSPALDPGPAGIDAYLWIKDPGASDGPCNGGPPAGQYWPQYAVTLGRSGSGLRGQS